jgi:hypothetical protein
MLKLIKEISNSNPDVVFVGGVALSHYDPTHIPQDIDIVVKNLDGLNSFGDIIEWNTDFVGSISTKRAYIKRDDFNIDIFIEDELPKYEVIDGIKYQTKDSLIRHYSWVRDFVPVELKERFQQKIDLLNNVSK